MVRECNRNHYCVVGMTEGAIWVNGQRHECLKTTDNSKAAHITLKETTVVLSEIIIHGTLAEKPNFSEGLVEPSLTFLRCNRVVLAKAVINTYWFRFEC